MIHPSKVIFRYLARRLRQTELQCYISYLDNALDFHLDFRTLSENLKTDSELGKSLYGEESEPVKFFDFKLSADWARLNNSVLPSDECLCFYYQSGKGSVGNGREKWFKIYDESTLSILLDETNKFKLKRHIFILKYDEKNNDYVIELLHQKRVNSFNSHITSERKFMQISTKPCKSFSSVINEILLLHKNIKEDNFQSIAEEINFNQFTNDLEILNHVEFPILLCSHTGCSIIKHNNKWTIKKNFFSNLSMFNETNINDITVICITSDAEGLYTAYYPKDEIRAFIVNDCVKSDGRIKDINEYLTKLSNTQLNEDEKILERKEKTEKWWKKYNCKCDSCSLAKEKYDMNISIYGTQKRVNIFLCIIEYLTIFNLKTEEILTGLIKVFALSISTLDIEAWTRKLKDYWSKVDHISVIGKKNKILALQEIALIGYADCFGMPTHWKCFQILVGKRKKTLSAKMVVRKLIKHIMSRKKTIENMKERLLQPLFNFITRYRKAHFEFWEKEFGKSCNIKEIEQSFKHSLVGKFELKLKKLKSCLFVYTFNGSKYDFILLHKLMVCILKERNHRKSLFVIKKGSQIIRMTIPKTNIQFVDIVDMIGPGSSLNKFAKLTGLKDCKMIFPFSCFDNPDFLKAKTLPKEKEMWYNDLKQTYFTDEEIEQAHSDFNKHKCKNVGEYLKLYLRLDCELLGMGVIKYFHSLYEKFEIHPIDCCKTTCASYVGYLMQNFLMKEKRIVQFRPNLLPLYGALKSACAGGYSGVIRHSADGADNMEDAINSHLSAEHNILGKGVVCWDVTQLYPTAAGKKLPYGTGEFTMKCKERKELMMTSCFDKHAGRLLNSSESQVVQYLSLVCYPHALRCYSHIHAGPGQICYGSSYKKRVDLCLVLNPGELKIIQYHDAGSHLARMSSHDLRCKLNSDGKEIEYNEITKTNDDQNKRYAEWITSKISELTVTYDIYNECELFHNKISHENVTYNSPKEYLQTFYPHDSIFKPTWLENSTFSCKLLLDKILNSEECDCGFIVIEKGCKEMADDEVSKLFGFCLQKNTPLPEELGSQARILTREIVEKNVRPRIGEKPQEYNKRLNLAVDNFLKKRVKTDFTLTRKSFVKDICLPVIWFKWLVKKRKILPSVNIIHYIHYEGRNYATNFIYGLLQDRHDLIMKGEKNSLQCNQYKLTLNSFYGQSLMEQNKFNKHTYAKDKSIRKKTVLKSDDIKLIGCFNERTKKQKKDKYSFLYMIKYPQKNCQIKNLLQVGATILGYSRVIFFDHLFNFLSLLDSRKSELCYIDTDSCFFFVADEDIKKCVKEGMENDFIKLSKNMFVDTQSNVTQAGKLKMEGYFKAGYFRCPKSYVLQPFSDTDERIVKNKGISSKVCNKIPNEAFLVNSRKRKTNNNVDDMFLQDLKLQRTMGEQITISYKRRKMSNPINCKRIMTEVSFFLKN